MNPRELVMTVGGPIAPADLGITHSHEHVLWDYFDMVKSYDSIFEDVAIAANELREFKEAGGGSLVDCSTTGIWSDPEALRRVSQASGVNIVLGAGWYRECVYPATIATTSTRHLGEYLLRCLTQGFDGTNVMAGFIGEIGTERGSISPAQERVFRAAALASRETGCSIVTHTTHFGELAHEQLDLLADCGVEPDRIVVSHLGDREDTRQLLEIAKRGVYLSIDNIGYQNDGYPSDNVRVASALALVEAGHLDQIVLGTDICTRTALKTYGGRGYAWLIREFIPLLSEAGLSRAEIDAMTTHNIARALARPAL